MPTLVAVLVLSSFHMWAAGARADETPSPTATPDPRFVAPPAVAHETWEAPGFEKAAELGAGAQTRTPVPEWERLRQYKPGSVLLSTALSGSSAGDGGPTIDVVFLWYIGRLLYFESPEPGYPIARRTIKWLHPLGAMLLGPDLKYSFAASDPEQPTLALGVFAPYILQIDPSSNYISIPARQWQAISRRPGGKRKLPVPLLAGYLVTTQHLGGLDVSFGAFGGTLSRLVSYLTTNPVATYASAPWDGHALAYAHVRGDPVAFGVFGGLSTRRPQDKVNVKLEVFAPVPHPQSPVLIHWRVTRFFPFDFSFLFYNWKKGYLPDCALLGMYDYRVTMFPKK